jgi:hypothetical protein
MDTDTAVDYGRIMLAAYVDPHDLSPADGQQVGEYTVVNSIYANDLSTDVNPEGGSNAVVSIGLLCQDAQGNVVVALRGTETVLEWVHDAAFNLVPFAVGGQNLGFTEDGFTAMYESMRTGADVDSPTVIQALQALSSISSLTLVGHSLGSAMVTLFAVELAVSFRTSPLVYAFGCPRVGDATFVAAYNQLVPNSWRIVNRLDIVPNLPLAPYEHVNTAVELNPVQYRPFEILVDMNIACEHDPYTYMYLLSGGQIPLSPGCQP